MAKRTATAIRIGVFDSGIGGKAIAESLRVSFPQSKITVVNDSKNVPYGDKPNDEIIKLTDLAVQPLLQSRCDVIVIACNTATAIAIDELRRCHPSQLFIGLEPMVKPATRLTKSNKIAVCATPATLKSDKYNKLKQAHSEVEYIEPDCSKWATMIERGKVDYIHIKSTIDDILQAGADVIILGCTHYHWIKEFISQAAKQQARVIDPSEAISQRVIDLIESVAEN